MQKASYTIIGLLCWLKWGPDSSQGEGGSPKILQICGTLQVPSTNFGCWAQAQGICQSLILPAGYWERLFGQCELEGEKHRIQTPICFDSVCTWCSHCHTFHDCQDTKVVFQELLWFIRGICIQREGKTWSNKNAESPEALRKHQDEFGYSFKSVHHSYFLL